MRTGYDYDDEIWLVFFFFFEIVISFLFHSMNDLVSLFVLIS